MAKNSVFDLVKWPGGTFTWIFFNMPNSTGTLRIDWRGTDKYRAFTLHPNDTEQYQYLKPGELGFKQYVYEEERIGNIIGPGPSDNANARTITPGVRLVLNSTMTNVTTQAFNNMKRSNNETEDVFVDGWAALYRKEGKPPLIVTASWFTHNLISTFLMLTFVVMPLAHYLKKRQH